VTSPTLQVLLIEDNPGDVYLITHALNLGAVPKSIDVVNDGEAALSYLHRRGRFRGVPRPDLVVLDLNLPRVDGRKVLAELKTNPVLMTIPVVILSSSSEPCDIDDAYERHANCFLTKPWDLIEYLDLVRAIEDYWMGCVALPV
jgi:chemotaxis family two-component system response regulator Rcp1